MDGVIEELTEILCSGGFSYMVDGRQRVADGLYVKSVVELGRFGDGIHRWSIATDEVGFQFGEIQAINEWLNQHGYWIGAINFYSNTEPSEIEFTIERRIHGRPTADRNHQD